MMFNVLLPLNIAMILIISEITKIIAPGKYQKLKSVLLQMFVNMVVKHIKMLMSVTIIDNKLEIEHFFILSFLSMSLFIK